jgi:uncharacterized protein (DUF849 family)
MRTILTATLGLSLAFAATAQAEQNQQKPGTVEYFIMHNAERHAMDQKCARATGWPAQCQAAQKADQYILLAESRQRVNANRLGVGSVDSPLYYDANPLARMMTLNECAHPTTINGRLIDGRPDAVACQAARISAGR